MAVASQSDVFVWRLLRTLVKDGLAAMLLLTAPMTVNSGAHRSRLTAQSCGTSGIASRFRPFKCFILKKW
jgi:hypothetical protein